MGSPSSMFINFDQFRDFCIFATLVYIRTCNCKDYEKSASFIPYKLLLKCFLSGPEALFLSATLMGRNKYYLNPYQWGCGAAPGGRGCGPVWLKAKNKIKRPGEVFLYSILRSNETQFQCITCKNSKLKLIFVLL